MPTLDDLPTLASFTPSGDDLLPIYDLTGNGSSKVRKVSLNQINGISAADLASPATITGTTGSVTVSTRMVRILGGAGNTGAVSTTIPLPSGALRDIIVQFFSAGAGTCVIGIAGGGTNIFSSAAAAAVNSLTIASGVTARFLSDGTNWYRTH